MMDTASLDANSTLPCHYYLNLETAGDSTIGIVATNHS